MYLSRFFFISFAIIAQSTARRCNTMSTTTSRLSGIGTHEPLNVKDWWSCVRERLQARPLDDKDPRLARIPTATVSPSCPTSVSPSQLHLLQLPTEWRALLAATPEATTTTASSSPSSTTTSDTIHRIFVVGPTHHFILDETATTILDVHRHEGRDWKGDRLPSWWQWSKMIFKRQQQRRLRKLRAALKYVEADLAQVAESRKQHMDDPTLLAKENELVQSKTRINQKIAD